MNEFEKQYKKVRKLQKLEDEDFYKKELLEQYITKLLYIWDNRKFKTEYLNKLEIIEKKVYFSKK